MAMTHQFTMQRMVEFAETDMAGIMHFSNYFRFMEATEHAFFRSLGLSVHSNAGEPMQGWARVQAECRYKEPLRYQDVVEIELLVREFRTKSIAYGLTFRRVGEDRVVAVGTMTVVCVASREDGSGMAAVEMPTDVRERIEVAPQALLDDRDF